MTEGGHRAPCRASSVHNFPKRIVYIKDVLAIAHLSPDSLNIALCLLPWTVPQCPAIAVTLYLCQVPKNWFLFVGGVPIARAAVLGYLEVDPHPLQHSDQAKDGIQPQPFIPRP